MKYKKRKTIFISCFIILTFIFSFFVYNVYTYNKVNKFNMLTESNNLKKIEKIKMHYYKNVKTNKNCEIFELVDGKYITVGILSKDFKINLEEQDIYNNTKYFKINGTNYYVNYIDVDKSEEYIKNQRYKKYVVFNENILTDKNVIFYRNDGSFIKLNKSFDLPIYIKDNDKYYVEYNDELFYVKKDSIREFKKSSNSDIKTRDNIRVLTYHTIYNPKTEKCTNKAICHSIEQFDSHMKYLNENNYLTLTMKELEMFLDKKIQIPKKSIVITLDDGSYAINALNIVEKNKVNATYFIVTGQFKIPDVQTSYLEYQSHTHNLHNNWKCPGGNQGGQLLCEKEDIILEDLKKSKQVIGGDVFALSYPFFDFNSRAIRLLKQAGFRMAFVGQYDTDGYSSYNTDRFKLRRKTIFSDDSLNTFINRLK